MANFPIQSWLVQNLQNRIEVHHCCFLCRKRIKCLIRYFNSESFPTIRIYNEMYSQHVRPEHNCYLLSSKILRKFTIIHYVQAILRLSTSGPNLQVFFLQFRSGGYWVSPVRGKQYHYQVLFFGNHKKDPRVQKSAKSAILMSSMTVELLLVGQSLFKTYDL